jgi:leucyl aminopeptidase
LPCPVHAAADYKSAPCDGVLLVARDLEAVKATGLPSALWSPIEDMSGLDEALHTDGALLRADAPGKRLVYAPTGPINPDSDDIRSFADAAARGVKRFDKKKLSRDQLFKIANFRALKAGIKCPLLILPTPCDAYPECDLVAFLGALDALYVVRPQY